MSRNIYIAIEGAIGVGKTTLARLLQPVFAAELLLEVFEENPFLGSFYAAFFSPQSLPPAASYGARCVVTWHPHQ